ncbi:MAG: ATP-binding protein [Spirochaeta sp.]|jgi:signal transduction histidine kinase|nr:ATP-binding protein [Spirochaeta sp.]
MTAGRGLSTRIRLTLIYTTISIVSVMVLFGLSFYSLYRTLQQDELRDMQSRLLSYWAQFQTGGIEFLQEQIDVDNLVVGERPFIVRIADRTNSTEFFSYPRVWESFNIGRLEMVDLDPGRVHILTSPDYEFEIEVAGIWLSEEYFLQLGLSTETRTRLMALFQRNFLVISLGVVLAGLIVGLLIASRALRPISRVTAVAREIVETGRLDARVERGTGGGELSQLVDLINRMLERISRLVDGMRNTVDMVAHDLRTPITRLRAQAELALRSNDAAEMEGALAGTVEQGDEILRFINTLLDITEAESGVMRLQFEAVEVPELCAQVKDLYDLVAEERDVTIDVTVPEHLTVQADRVRLRQVVANLVDNAVKYCREHGTVRITAEGVPAASAPGAAPRNLVRITVSDTGLGLSAEERERVWERMYRGPVQPAQRGLGLGLSLVRAVVAAHGGRTRVASQPGQGAEFIVEIPKRNER